MKGLRLNLYHLTRNMTNKELTEKILLLIKDRIPTDDFGSYGGTGALSYEEICEMFIDDLVPEILKLCPEAESPI